MSYEKDKLDSYVTSASLSTALAPYITSNSSSAAIAAAIAGVNLAPYMTSNSISAAVTTDTLTVRGAAAVSATMSAGAVTVAGRPVGAVLLGYTALNNVTAFAFSGSWSDYPVLELASSYRMSGSQTASIAFFQDGGTTEILNLFSGGVVIGAAGVEVMCRLTGNGVVAKVGRVSWYHVGAIGVGDLSSTFTAGFVNCIRYNQSKTMSSGMAILWGYRSS